MHRNESANRHLIPPTPSGPSGSTLGPTPINSDLSLPSSEESHLPITPDLRGPLPPRTPPIATSSDLVLLRGNAPKKHSYDNHSTLSFISSFLFPKVSPAPHVPLSFLGEPNLQISHMTPGELELTL
ncbi:hypothetical protein BDM02DRAFT_3121127 [Thelephora ganbajun]|uniref:Uncharacterized protein n=1 Tax=Thelephora ganbajun TaxID=370292 RepID=A0ACB6Z6E7_THEGA|nr:hypothetical protein BDM02DRAFT_3121127 [Thelephora ganbajun]